MSGYYMQQGDLLHFWLFFILIWGQNMKKLFCCPALELFCCLPHWKTVLLSSSRAFKMSNPMENTTWKKSTKCNKNMLVIHMMFTRSFWCFFYIKLLTLVLNYKIFKNAIWFYLVQYNSRSWLKTTASNWSLHSLVIVKSSFSLWMITKATSK